MGNKSAKKLKLMGRTKSSMAEFPSVSSVLEDGRLKPVIQQWSFAFVSREVKQLVSEWKKRKGPVPSKDDFITETERRFANYERQLIQPVINGTGVILHTNLGRAPLSSLAYEELVSAVTGYSNLEFDLGTGKRSQRGAMAGRMVATLSGAEAGLIVNNNAAAVFLIVANLAAGKEVIISRGQLIQIGGGFRIPEIIERSGAFLKEIGTTNKTSLTDYRKAITKNTGLVLAVHKSNFVQKGFTDEPEVARIVEIAGEKKIPVCYDLGSGLIDKKSSPGGLAEPTVVAAVRTKADLVCFSGDKLLGGPQAGLIVGKRMMIESLSTDPLYRALRPGKLTIGLLESALVSYLRGSDDFFPCWQMASLSVADLEHKAQEISATVGNPKVTSIRLSSSFGGGSLPEYEFESCGIKIAGNPVALAQKLRAFSTPVICRTIADGVLIDLRTVLPEHVNTLTDAIRSCL